MSDLSYHTRDYTIHHEYNYDNYENYDNSYSDPPDLDHRDGLNNGTLFGYLMCGLLIVVSFGSSCQLFNCVSTKYNNYQTNKNFKEILLNDNIDKICSICLEQYTIEDKIIQLNCSHIFHRKCIESWFKDKDKNKKVCPLCRIIII
tara:strand:- start:626 stop:1063 length:438 start_codon:yes stop_codon:yes gene_type:complete